MGLCVRRMHGRNHLHHFRTEDAVTDSALSGSRVHLFSADREAVILNASEFLELDEVLIGPSASNSNTKIMLRIHEKFGSDPCCIVVRVVFITSSEL
jgi:hypothetical protein